MPWDLGTSLLFFLEAGSLGPQGGLVAECLLACKALGSISKTERGLAGLAASPAGLDLPGPASCLPSTHQNVNSSEVENSGKISICQNPASRPRSQRPSEPQRLSCAGLGPQDPSVACTWCWGVPSSDRGNRGTERAGAGLAPPYAAGAHPSWARGAGSSHLATHLRGTHLGGRVEQGSQQ